MNNCTKPLSLDFDDVENFVSFDNIIFRQDHHDFNEHKAPDLFLQR